MISTNNRSVTSSARTPTTIYQRVKGRHDVWYWRHPDPIPRPFSNAACFYQATWTNHTHAIHTHASAPKLTRPPVFRWRRQTSHASPSRKYWWWETKVRAVWIILGLSKLQRYFWYSGTANLFGQLPSSPRIILRKPVATTSYNFNLPSEFIDFLLQCVQERMNIRKVSSLVAVEIINNH